MDNILNEGPFDEHPRAIHWLYVDRWFDIKLWNHFRNADIRVKNKNEGYNSRFNNKCPASHPNIWKFIELIQEEEYLLVQIRCCKLLDGTCF